MAYALYSPGKQLGPLGPIFLVDQMEDAIQRFDRIHKGRGKIPALAALFKYGETHKPEKAAKDVSRLLTLGTGMRKNVAGGFQLLKQLLLKVRGEATMGEA